MTTHSAESLFNLNIQSAKDSLALYDAIATLRPQQVDIDWVLRAAIVFTVSALDTYFHDKVKYRIGRFDLENCPSALGSFQVQVKQLQSWDRAKRKGNVLRNWVTDYLAVRPLQSPSSIAETLKMAGIDSFWERVEPDPHKRASLKDKVNELVRRRNQISHEGDRMTSRRSGKALRPIGRSETKSYIAFVENLVQDVEAAFPG